jgi:hypothetical protein
MVRTAGSATRPGSRSGFTRTDGGVFGFGWLSSGDLLVQTTEDDPAGSDDDAPMSLTEFQDSIRRVLGAVNLAWKLAAVISGWAPSGLLETYHSERHFAGARALLQTQAQEALRRGQDPAGEALRELFLELLADEQPPPAWRISCTPHGPSSSTSPTAKTSAKPPGTGSTASTSTPPRPASRQPMSC